MNEDVYIMKIYLPSFCEGCNKFKFDKLEFYSNNEVVDSDYTCANMRYCTYLRELWKKQEGEK